MTDEEKNKELTRNSFAAQMAMLGYEPNGNPKDMVEVVRCKNCRHYSTECCSNGCGWCCRRHFGTNDEWYCADGERQ